MKDILYKEIFKAFNEDLNMILSDDDFKEPEIDLGVHIQNILNNINLLLLKKNVADAIENKDLNSLKELIENQWDGETAFYLVNNENIKDVVNLSVQALGEDANLNWIDTSDVTNMSDLFSGNYLRGLYNKFKGDISSWDVSNVTNMASMFFMSMFNGDISKWDVSNIQDMTFMFFDSMFKGDISGWDVSSVTNMSYMFAWSKFHGDISKWNVSNVTNMSLMFNNSTFNNDISGWNVRNVLDNDLMFTNCPIKKEYKPKFND